MHRLLNRIIIFEEDDCWYWTAGTFKSGYGQVRLDGKNYRVHRAVWFCYTGEEPEVLHHICLNILCCNPEHLEPKAHREHAREHQLGKRSKTCRKGHPLVVGNIRMNGKQVRCALCVRKYQREYKKRCYAKLKGKSKSDPAAIFK